MVSARKLAMEGTGGTTTYHAMKQDSKLCINERETSFVANTQDTIGVKNYISFTRYNVYNDYTLANAHVYECFDYYHTHSSS